LPGVQNSEALKAILPAINEGRRLPVIWLHRMEVSNAFEQRVFISRSGGEVRVSTADVASAQAQFSEDCASAGGLLQQTVIPMDRLEKQFLEISLRHTGKHGFRTYDILHVSSALLFGCDTFWSFDAKCSKLAKLEGMKTL
jgi:predicted nucleic acid-binding protein